MTSLFWKDLATDLEDPEFLREYVRESVRIATVDAIMNALDDARVAEGLSKAELARVIGAEPAVVRRLFAAGNTNPNPTLGTLVDVAAALGLQVKIEPLPDEERRAVTEQLRSGTVTKAAIERLIALRQSSPRGSTQPA
jgi:DNA-binding phage protein